MRLNYYLFYLQAASEAAEAEQYMEELGVKETDSLQALIKARHSERAGQADDFFAHLEEKYGAPKTKKTKKTAKKTSKK